MTDVLVYLKECESGQIKWKIMAIVGVFKITCGKQNTRTYCFD